MKNLSFTLAVLACVCFTDLDNGFATKDSYRLPDPVSKEFNSVHYLVYPQIELISIVQAISDYPKTFGFLMQPDSFQYKLDVLKHFGLFSHHPAVELFNRMCMQPRKMNFSAPAFVML